ncbi:MAG: pyridoxal phosphate-dependent aminotransferase [Fidelibacterota bacterium]
MIPANQLRFASRVSKIQPSLTLEMASRATELREQGEDVINFSVGEPDFNTPRHIREAGKAAIDQGYTKYTAGPGMLELRQAICAKLQRDNGLSFSPDQILVSNGEKQSLYTACLALFQAGDEVLVFRPYWVSYPEFVRLADAEPVFVDTVPERQFEPDWEDLARKITPRTRGLITNSPSNPTGGIWSEEANRRILELARQNDWVVLADECYEQLVYSGRFTSLEALNTASVPILTLMSLSKTYAMTGWRIGYAAGDRDLIRAMARIQSQATSCANAIGQKAAVEALIGDQTPVREMRDTFRQRRDLMVSLLREIKQITCVQPEGAFYAFPDFSAYLGKSAGTKIIKDSFDLSQYILDSAKVVTVPGDGFGAPGHIRFSFATDLDSIKKGIQRIAESLGKLA